MRKDIGYGEIYNFFGYELVFEIKVTDFLSEETKDGILNNIYDKNRSIEVRYLRDKYLRDKYIIIFDKNNKMIDISVEFIRKNINIKTHTVDAMYKVNLPDINILICVNKRLF